MNKKTVMKIIPIVVLVLALAGGFLLFNKKPASSPAVVEATVNKISVKVKKVETVENISNLSYEASLEPVEEGYLSSKIGGKVVEVLLENSKYISKGDPVIRLDDQDIRNSLKLAESQLAASNAGLLNIQMNLENAQRDFDRQKALLDQGAISSAVFENSEAALKAAKVSLEVSKANIQTNQVTVENLRSSLSNTIITAPISGVVSEKNVNLGQYVNPGATLGKVIDISSVYAVIDVGQDDLNFVKVGQKTQVKVGQTDSKAYSGEVSSVEASANSSSRSFKGRVRIENKDQVLRPGIYAKVEIPNNQQREMIALPMEALSGNGGSYSVYMNDNGIARKKSVTIGDFAKNMVEIKTGVQKGDAVICTNVNMLQDGSEITIVAE